MPEAKCLPLAREHPGPDAFVDTRERFRSDRLEQGQLRLRRRHRHRLQQSPGCWAQPGRTGKNCVANRGRDVLIRRDRLGHEEGIAAGPAVQLLGIGSIRRRKRPNTLERERRKSQPSNRPARSELSERTSEWMETVELAVAVGHENEHRDGSVIAAEQPKHVERRVIRPVHILQHEDGRDRALELAYQREGHLVREGATLEEVLEFATARLGDLDEGRERAGRERGSHAPTRTRASRACARQ